MVLSDLNLSFELIAMVLTILYIGKLLLERKDWQQAGSNTQSHICPFAPNKGVKELGQSLL